MKTTTMRSPVPKFGNWESEENVPYTAYFDNARKNKSSGKMNPNDPQENPDMFLPSVSPIQAPQVQEDVELKGQKGPEAARPKHERPVSRENGELRRQSDSPLHPDASHQRHGGVRSGSSKSDSGSPRVPDALRPKHERPPSREDSEKRPTDSPLHHDPAGRRANVDSPHHHSGMSAGDTTPKRVTRQSFGADRSIEHSPLHSNYQPRVGGKSGGVSSPSWERKGSSEGSHGLAPSTPGRSRLRSVNRGDETPDHSPAVPKFGDWDENDPASAEGYTHIFETVRKEKQNGAEKVPVMQNDTYSSNGQKNNGKEDCKTSCCFWWRRK